jgi:AcrR family transcriptional regulator
MAVDLKEQVLEASVALIAEAGVAGLSLREVARRAGVSHQAPYHYFPDRESILAALVERGFTELGDRMIAAASGKGAVKKRLAAAGRAYVDFALERPVYFRLMFRPELVNVARFPLVQQAGQRAYGVLEGLVAEKLERRRAPAGTAEAMASMHWSVVHGLSALLLDGSMGKMFPEKKARDAHIARTLELFSELA